LFGRGPADLAKHTQARLALVGELQGGRGEMERYHDVRSGTLRRANVQPLEEVGEAIALTVDLVVVRQVRHGADRQTSAKN
jgi:hypothetical protein